jgi:parallel beta-helix repeat protein
VNAVLTDNYVHDNYNAGIWLDFDNTGADISHNYVASNWGNGIIYEASYNTNISDNTLVGNGWASDGPWPAGVQGKDCYGNVSCTGGLGPVTGAGGGLPYSAIYLPNSGGNPNLGTVTVPRCSSHCVLGSRYSGKLLVQRNLLLNNFGGVSVYTDTNRFPGNIDDDSACSVPLGALNQSNSGLYYQQSQLLVTGDNARVSGTSVTSSGGTHTLCSDYGASQRSEGSGGNGAAGNRVPSPGMAVFNINTGALLGEVSSAASANSFTLRAPAAGVSGASLLLSAYGGCGPADYYKAGHGIKSGRPAALYWDNCVWGSQNVTVTGNTFEMQAFKVAGCSTQNMCGFMQTMAFNAGVPDLMQFFQSYPDLIARGDGGLGNVWRDNNYAWTGSGADGTWHFMAGLQGSQIQFSQWQAAPYGQDAGSTLHG